MGIKELLITFGGVEVIKRTYMFFAVAFVLVTVLTILSIIMVMICNQKDMDGYTEIESQEDMQSSDYWTKERMEDAELLPMPVVSKTEYLKEIVKNSLSILIMLFMIFTSVFILMNIKKIKTLEKQNDELLNKLSNLEDKRKM